ncbi:hypothetical protein ACJJTC_016795 [Scirpophaga incertulas]
MGMAFEIFSVAYLVPGSACELLTTSSQQGLMAAVPLIGIIATSHFWGYLADTRGRKKVLCLSMSLSFLSGSLAALSPDWITFCLLKFLSSSAVSGAFALSMTLLSECTLEAKRSVLVILTSSVFLCCNGIMAMISIPVLPLQFSYYIPFLNIHFNSWRFLDLIFSLPSGLSVFALMFAYESPRYLLNVGENEKALEVLRSIFVINNNKSGEDYPVKSVVLDELSINQAAKGFIASVASQTVPLFRPPLLRNTILLAFIFVVVYICVHPFMVWLPYMVDGFMRSVQRDEENMTFCQRLRASQNTTVADEMDAPCTMNQFAMTMVLSVTMLLALINTVATAIINVFGRKRLFITLQFCAAVAAMCVNYVYAWQFTAVLIITIMSGVINFGLLTSFTVDVFPTSVKAMAVCLTLMMGRGSAVFGVNLLKYLLDSDCETSFYLSASMALLGGIVGFFLPREAKPPTADCPET